MKKIGLITYHASHNIGSLLQTYAMRYVLQENFDYNVEIIDFSSPAQRDLYSFYDKQTGWRPIVKNLIIFIFQTQFRSRYNDFDSFIDLNFSTSMGNYSNSQDMSELEGQYDIVIAGSDQIWNVNCIDFDDAYFIDFVKSPKKVAYAPSLGGRNILNSGVDLDKYRKLIGSFDSLSVREKNGKRWLEALTGRQFELVPDPTLLINREVWEKLSKRKIYKEDYIFFYGIPFNTRTYDVVKAISDHFDMPVVMIDVKSYYYRGNFLRGFKLSPHSAPGDYLALIRDAFLVLTTSFHGTIFSTIYRKNFWTITFKGTNPDDDRISTLLQLLGMENRMIYMENIVDVDLKELVDYSSYMDNVGQLRSIAFNYLKNAI